MRQLKEIPHPLFKITVFHWNNKYILKVEAGKCEQVYKLDAADVPDENKLDTFFTDALTEKIKQRFVEMHKEIVSYEWWVVSNQVSVVSGLILKAKL